MDKLDIEADNDSIETQWVTAKREDGREDVELKDIPIREGLGAECGWHGSERRRLPVGKRWITGFVEWYGAGIFSIRISRFTGFERTNRFINIKIGYGTKRTYSSVGSA